MDKRTASKLSKDLERIKRVVAAERDRLDELISDAESLRESCIEAIESLDYARDSISQWV